MHEVARRKKLLSWVWRCVLKALDQQNFKLIKSIKKSDGIATLRHLSSIFADDTHRKFQALKDAYTEVKQKAEGIGEYVVRKIVGYDALNSSVKKRKIPSTIPCIMG